MLCDGIDAGARTYKFNWTVHWYAIFGENDRQIRQAA